MNKFARKIGIFVKINEMMLSLTGSISDAIFGHTLLSMLLFMTLDMASSDLFSGTDGLKRLSVAEELLINDLETAKRDLKHNIEQVRRWVKTNTDSAETIYLYQDRTFFVVKDEKLYILMLRYSSNSMSVFVKFICSVI